MANIKISLIIAFLVLVVFFQGSEDFQAITLAGKIIVIAGLALCAIMASLPERKEK